MDTSGTPASPGLRSAPRGGSWRPSALRVAAWAGAAAVLVGVLALYTQPGFLVMLSEMIWACFG